MATDALEQLVVIPDLIGTLARQADVAAKWGGAIASLMADDECRHGRLASDPTPACGCWPGEALAPGTQLLHCANGAHHWTRPAQRGRPPGSCPAHPKAATC